MIEAIQKATASSPEGARGLVKGVLACAVQNVAFSCRQAFCISLSEI